MANLLKMALIETIRALHRQNWSQRRIAEELGINRETVARHLRGADLPSKPANAPPARRRSTTRQNHPMRPPAPWRMRSRRNVESALTVCHPQV
jgi:IS30 family transposase